MADMFYPRQKDYIAKLNWLATQYANISMTVNVAAPLTSTGGANPVIGISPATVDAPGSMSAADKAKLDGIAAAAAAVGNVVAKALGSAVAGVSTSAARADHVHPMPAAADVGAVATSAVGAANGVAPLDASGKVAASYLPSYVDDVLEFANLAAFPASGEGGKIYVADDTNLTYRWSGTGYVEISPSPGSTDAVPEGAKNQYFTAERARVAVTSVAGNAGTASQLATARAISATGDATGTLSFDGSSDVEIALTLAASGVEAGKYGSASTVPVITVDAKGRVTSISTTAVSGGTGGGGSVSVDVAAPLTSTGGDNPMLGIDPATEDAPGSMSAADKAKLDGIAAGAAAVSGNVAKSLGAASAGASLSAARDDHVHPMPLAADVGAVAASAVGAANGVAPLDSTGKVAAAYLPSYVDDVVEYANLAAFPATGESGKIYVADDTGKIYRWSGSAYIEISASPGSTDAVPEGATNQYFTVGRVLSAILTGFSTASSAAVAATDSILTAIGKLQAQITGKAAVGNTAGAALAAAGAAGSAVTAARSDHVHPYPSAANVGAVATTAVGAANGVASLGADGLVPTSQLPAMGGAQTGDILYTGRNPGAGYLKADGSLYAQAAYPALFGVLGFLLQAGSFSAAVARTTGLGTAEIYSICYGNGLYVAVTDAGTLATSPDGVTWTLRTSGFGTSLIWDVRYVNGMFFAGGASAKLATSTDGITWTLRTVPISTNYYVNAVSYGNGIYVAVCDLGKIVTSPDGITWTTRSGASSSDVYDVCFANGMFVAVGLSGYIQTSTDGINWTLRASFGASIGLFSVCYANGLFVAVGTNGNVATSTNGTGWTTSVPGFSTAVIYSVCYGNGMFVAVGANGILATSPDAVTWTTRDSGMSGYEMRSIIYNNGTFMGGGKNGKLFAYFAAPYDMATQFILPSLPSYAGSIPYIKT